MSAANREALGRLREKFARVFGVALKDVETEELEGDTGRVWCPSRTELPEWTT